MAQWDRKTVNIIKTTTQLSLTLHHHRQMGAKAEQSSEDFVGTLDEVLDKIRQFLS